MHQEKPTPQRVGLDLRQLVLVLVLITRIHRAEFDANAEEDIIRLGLGHKDFADAGRDLLVLGPPSLLCLSNDGEGVAVHLRPADGRVVRPLDGGFAEDFGDDFISVAHMFYLVG